MYALSQTSQKSNHANVLLQNPTPPRRLSLAEWLTLSLHERQQQPVPPYGLPLADGSAWHMLTLTDGSIYGFIPQWQAFYCGKSRPGKLLPHGDGTLWTQQLDDGKLYVVYARFEHGRLPVRSHATWSCRPKDTWKQEPSGTMPPIAVVPPSEPNTKAREAEQEAAAQRQADFLQAMAEAAARRQAEQEAQAAARRQAEQEAQAAARRQADFQQAMAEAAAQRQAEQEAQAATDREIQAWAPPAAAPTPPTQVRTRSAVQLAEPGEMPEPEYVTRSRQQSAVAVPTL